MGVRIVATYRPAKKRSYEKGLHLEYLKRELRWIFRSQKTEGFRNGDARQRAVRVSQSMTPCFCVEVLMIPHVCGMK